MPTPVNNPIINSPFEKPKRYFQFTDEKVLDSIQLGRRESAYFVPIPKPKSKSGQTGLGLVSENEYLSNKLINHIRERVDFWRHSDYRHATTITRRLLEYWRNPQRERRLFFCQIEALETWIYLTEIAPKYDANVGTHLLAQLDEANREATPIDKLVIKRRAAKMATGSGKTVVMAMLIAWQALNKINNRHDKRFTDAFLIVAPGITIKDRLRVLRMSDPENYYNRLDIVPPEFLNQLGQAKIEIINYHAFMPRDNSNAASLTKKILTRGRQSSFEETPGQMVSRVCKSLMKGHSKREILVINDEAHHCYHLKPLPEVDDKLTGDDKKEAEDRAREARVWINGLEAIANKIGIRAVYDLSATPYFLAGSGWREGTLFPWVTSDFAMIDAIESGIIKVPRVPVADNTVVGEKPIYRNLWPVIGKQLPKGRRHKQNDSGEPQLPQELESALHTLYGHYKQSYDHWQIQVAAGYASPPPVFIVVCSNTTVSKLVFDWIAGWETKQTGQLMFIPGQLPIFSNVHNEQWIPRPNTILVDSKQLESGESVTDEFMAAAAPAIETFKAELCQRFPDRKITEVNSTDILREVMNTVGKPGKLGEQIKCVVSVSMLSEGWDVNTVTHILGIRAFGTQLLCEQVIGRGLRRMRYETEQRTITINGTTETIETFPAEYAEVYGVPFEFIPDVGGGNHPLSHGETHVHTIEERHTALLTFPRVIGYRHRFAIETLTPLFTESSRFILDTKHIATITENAPIVGDSVLHTPNELKLRRQNEVVFLLAKVILEKYFRHDGDTDYVVGGRIHNPVKVWLFPALLNAIKTWLANYVECKDHTFPQMLLLTQLAHTAADRVYSAIVAGQCNSAPTAPILLPLLQSHNMMGNTHSINYFTSKPTYRTGDKCHLSHVVKDSNWEETVIKTLEWMPEVKAYVKNVTPLDWSIPYTHGGYERRYFPDLIVKLDDGRGADDLLNLIIEVSGEQRTDKDAKVDQVSHLWIPAINNDGRFGRWGFVQIKDSQDVIKMIRETVNV